MQPTKNKFLILFISSVTIIIIVVIYVFLAIKRPNSGTSAPIDFEVKPGESLSEVGSGLFQKKLINSENLFRMYAHFDKRGNQIQTGYYKIPGNLTISSLLDVLIAGPGDLHLTFIEGWRREQMAEHFAKYVPSDNAYSDFLTSSASSEGRLFPDTYFVPQQVIASAMVDLLTRTFDQKITSEMKKGFTDNGLSEDQALVMSSLIEREAVSDVDKALVAGVFYNRLKSEWFLNVDASVQYAVTSQTCQGLRDCTWWPKSLSAADLKIDSPYNTYINKGLPPAPICNPGLASLAAVANPTKSDHYFYLTDKDGIFHYAKTIEEHNQNIVKYLT